MKPLALGRFLATGLLTVCLTGIARAGGELQVIDPWVREAPPTASVHAAYLTLENSGDAPVFIDSVSSPDFDGAEIHRSWIEDGVARMQPIERLEVPAGDRIALEPGGNHLMLFDARRALAAGDSVTLLLHRAGGDCLRVTAPVRRATESGHQHH